MLSFLSLKVVEIEARMIMHFVCFSMWAAFSHTSLSKSHKSHLRRGWDSKTSGEISISHGNYKTNFLAYFILQGTLTMLHILRKVEDHENHVRWMYLTYHCSQHGETSEKYVRSRLHVHPSTPRMFLPQMIGRDSLSRPLLTWASCTGTHVDSQSRLSYEPTENIVLLICNMI